MALLRYDAFEDVGGRLSFSCAMLDDHGTGVVLTSINGRQETRVYAKPIADGDAAPTTSRSEEEEAIRQAMARGGPSGGGAMIFKKDEDDETSSRTRNPRRRVVGRRPRTRSERRAQMAENGEVTVVGVGARLDGNVVSAGSLRIDGQVKGQINADGDVTLSPQSQVEADIRAQNVTVAGRFKGNIAVKGKAHLARGGRVDGNITSKSLVVEEGGIFHGQSIMDGAATGSSSSSQADSQAQPRTRLQGHDREDAEQVKVP